MRGINLAIAWGMKTVHLKTDSATVHKWVEDALSGRTRLNTKARGEMLIRRRIDLIRQLEDEIGLCLSVQLVPSAQNRVDILTRIPSDWLRSAKDAVERKEIRDSKIVPSARSATAATVLEGGNSDLQIKEEMSSIASKHEEAGHPGVRRMLYFARRDITRSVTWRVVQTVLAQCLICQSVDLAPVKWRHGSLAVLETWWRLAIDIRHFKGQAYLTVVDYGPSLFSSWMTLRRMDTACVSERLEDIFYERGSPVEVLADNDKAFRSHRFGAFASRWGGRICLRFRAVYRPSGNSIVERNHRTVKVIATMKQCLISETVHLYNISPKGRQS